MLEWLSIRTSIPISSPRVAVVECGGFSMAAERLMKGQSAVSLQIRRLEARLGVTVLPREMAPHDLTVLNNETLELPVLDDTEMAHLEAPGLSPAAERLRDHVVRQLEHGA